MFDCLLHCPADGSTTHSDGEDDSIVPSEVLNLKHLHVMIDQMRREHRKTSRQDQRAGGRGHVAGKHSHGTEDKAKRMNVITAAQDPYGLAERIWNILDVDEVGSICMSVDALQ